MGTQRYKNTTKDPNKYNQRPKTQLGVSWRSSQVTVYLHPTILTAYLHLLTGEGAVNF